MVRSTYDISLISQEVIVGKEDFIMPLKYKRRFERWDSEKCKAILMAMFDYTETGMFCLAPVFMDSFEAIKDDMDIVRA